MDSSYTVSEYENAVEQFGKIHDEEGLKKSFVKMADLFDKSLEQNKEILHKFFVYQLSNKLNYSMYARSAIYGIPPVSVIFDVGKDLKNGKVNKILFKCPSIMTNKIIVSTANEMREEKDPDSNDGDMRFEYKHFNIIDMFCCIVCIVYIINNNHSHITTKFTS